MSGYAMRLTLALVLCAFASTVQAQGSLNDALLAEGAKHQVIQFNPTAALQSRIFAERFVPNSSEFNLTFEAVEYAAQRAESLSTGAVRVYFVRVGDWGNVRFTSGGDTLGNALMAEAQAKQVIQFNPGASLQQRMFADGFVPNSPEFSAAVSGVNYAAQRAENLGNGQVRVYYVVVGDWANVRNTAQSVVVAAPPSPPQPAPAAPAGSGVAPPAQRPTQGMRGVPGSSSPCQPGQIKANLNSNIYHVPGQRDYTNTYANVVCYDTEEQAQAAGFRRAER